MQFLLTGNSLIKILKVKVRDLYGKAASYTLCMIVLCNNETDCPMLNNEPKSTRVRRKERIIAAKLLGTLKSIAHFLYCLK